MDLPKKGMSSEGDQVSAPVPSPHSSTSSNSEGNKKKRQPTRIAEDELANPSPSSKAVKSLIVGPGPFTTLVSERLLKTEISTGRNVFLEKNHVVQTTPEYYREMLKNPQEFAQKLRQDNTRYMIWLVNCDEFPVKDFIEDVHSLGDLVNSIDDLDADVFLCSTSSNIGKNYPSLEYLATASINSGICFTVVFLDQHKNFQQLMQHCIQRMKGLVFR